MIKENNIYRYVRDKIGFGRYFALLLSAALILAENTRAQDFYLNTGASLTMNDGAVLYIGGDLTIEDAALMKQNGTGTIKITGDITINGSGAFQPGTGLVSFVGNVNSIIGGTASNPVDFYDVIVTKDDPANIVYLAQDVKIGNDLNINKGHLTFENTAARELKVVKNIDLQNTNCTFEVENSGAITHKAVIGGNIDNGGNINLDNTPNSVADITFNGEQNSTFSGRAPVLHNIKVDKDDAEYEVLISTSNLTVPEQFLTLTKGIFHITGTFSLTNTFFPVPASTYYINSVSGLWIDNPNVTVTGQDATLYLSGLLRSKGHYNIGNGSSLQNLIYNDGATLHVENGELNVDGRISRNFDNDKINYTQENGTVRVGRNFRSSDNDRGMFDIGETSSTFTWNDGTIELQRDMNGATTVGDYVVLASAGTVTGGLLRINDQNAFGEEYLINTIQPVGEFEMAAKDGTRVRLAGDAATELHVLGDITLAGTNSNYFNAEDYSNNSHNVEVGGNWINNFGDAAWFMAGSGKVTFNGDTTQYIRGTQSTTFHDLTIDQTVSGDTVVQRRETTVNGFMRIVSQTIFNMYGYDLNLGQDGEFYSDNGNGQTFDNKLLLNNGGSTGTDWAEVRRYYPDDASLAAAKLFIYPVGTYGPSGGTVYTPGFVELQAGTQLSSAYIAINCIPQEHPDVESPNRSLKKYWKILKSGVTLGAQGINLEFYYNAAEEVGSIGNYHVLQRAASNWFVDPGNDLTNVNIGLRRIRAVQVTDPWNEDWTAGELDAARSKYYSIADGNYNDASSWSKESYVGAASTTAPHLSADEVYIGNYRTITLTANTPSAAKITIDNTGRLNCGTYYVPSSVDSFFVKDGGALGIAHIDGITKTSSNGNIRAGSRNYSLEGTYIYYGTSSPQYTGNGLPTHVSRLVINKNTLNNSVNLSQTVEIGDSLEIYEGTLFVGQNYDIDGEDPGNRTFSMYGGRVTFEANFPTGYQPPWFYAGQIDFNGTGSLEIPSGGSSPGVMQYNDLRIRGNRAYSYISFKSEDTIRIYGNFDISNVSFTNFATPRFITAGTTIMFNGDGNQYIPRNSGTDETWAKFNYYNLIIDGSGTKELDDYIKYYVNNNVYLDNATFALNSGANYDLEVQGNWFNNGGDFQHNNREVIFNNANSGDTNIIKSENIPFYDVSITGSGAYYYENDMTVADDISINTDATLGGFDASSSTFSKVLSVGGNWTDYGTFRPGAGTVKFNGSGTQTVDKIGNETFFTLDVNKPTGNLVINDVANRSITADSIIFNQGNIYARTNGRFVAVKGNILRPGTGHVDGPLRMYFGTDTTDVKLFASGEDDNYRPAMMQFKGVGGNPGYIQMVNSLTDAGFFASNGNSFLIWDNSVNRRWDFSIPTGAGYNTFDFGYRTFDLNVGYENTDINNFGTTDPLQFVTRRLSGSNWDEPATGTRTANTTQSLGHKALGAVIVGEPAIKVFYSIADGVWSDGSTWSTAGYGGPATSAPPDPDDSVRIGDGITVTLDEDISISAQRAIIIETAGPSNLNGRLDCGAYVVSGNGNFIVDSGGALGVGHDDGITSNGSAGNIQTSTIPAFNYNNHNSGHFVYYGSANQVTGTGLPSVIATLTIDNPANEVLLTNNVSVRDSLHIKNGTFDAATNSRDINLGGNWINEGTFTEGSRTVTFDGTGLQKIINTNNEEFYNLQINKSSGTVTLVDNDITVNGTLSFPAANKSVLDSRTYGHSVIVAGTVSRTSGHVDGEMQKYFGTGDINNVVFEIGTAKQYTPAEVNIGPETGDAGSAGYIGMITYGTDHPKIDESTLNLDKNVQRYWSAIPKTGFSLGDRAYELKLHFIYPDDIRNGADYNDFVIRRYAASTTWTDADLVDETPGNYYAYASNIKVMGEDYALGVETPQGKKYYSIASGSWSNPNSWSPDGFGGSPDGTYPNQSLLEDIAIIGNGKMIVLDSNRIMSSVSVLDTLSGRGHLVFGTYYIEGGQFELKSGGMISIGSRDGITQSADAGNVRTVIRNYNHNNHGNGYFEYTGDAATTGDGLPSKVAQLSVNLNSGNTIVLENPVEVRDSLKILAGTLDCNDNNINVNGIWYNDDTYQNGTETVTFNGTSDQYVAGSSVTVFNNVTLNKTSGNFLLSQSMQVDGDLNLATNVLVKVLTSDLIIGPNGTMSPSAAFGSARMVQFDGTSSAGRLIKKFQDGNNTTRTFEYPVGIASDYNKAVLAVRADYTNGRLGVRVQNGPHPQRQPGQDNMLKKYWNISTQGISNLQSVNPDSRFEFYFVPTDIVGDRLKYIPAVYNSADGWEVNVGYSYNIDMSRMQINSLTMLDGDWTMAEPQTFFKGRVYYSISSGNWDEPARWSNVSHTGPQSLLSPGYFENDTVYIDDDDVIAYNVADSALKIGYLRIGYSGVGALHFRRGTNKHLIDQGDFYVGNGGSIGETGGGSRHDTLSVWGNVTNNATGGNVVDLRLDADRYTKFILCGSGNTNITGSGTWNFQNVEINKTGGLADTVFNNSAGFNTGLNSSVSTNAGDFELTSGIYYHGVNQSLTLDYNNDNNDDSSPGNDPIYDGWDFYMGDNSGLTIPQGTIYIGDDMVTNNNTVIDISGGSLVVGTGDNENFIYNNGTKLSVSAGSMTVAACFTNRTETAAIELDLSGGTITVVNDYSNQRGDIYGFGMKSNSTFNWSGGRIIYANPTDGGWDYVVQASNYNITGGTLQFGIVGNFMIKSTQSHSMGSSTPIWNLEVDETRYLSGPDVHSSLVLLDPVNRVLNDIIINSHGTLDLNGKTLYVGGDFTNNGRFTPDGRGWDADGSRQVIFNGSGDQHFYNANTYTNAQSGTSMNNEPFYDLFVAKPDGDLILDNDNSIIYVRNKLEFRQSNTAVIDARTNDQRVEIWTRSGDLGEVNRSPSGLGHVDGKLRMEVSDAGEQSVLFHVGAGDDYTPATIDFSAGSGSAGKVQVITYGNDPANISQNGVNIDLNRNIQRYWTVTAYDGFALGTRQHDLTLEFLDPQDKRGGNVNWSILNQFYIIDPDDPAPPPYTVLQPGNKTLTSNQSVDNTLFSGSYIVAELTSLNFYSRQDGDWDDPNTWSNSAYGGPPAPTWPQLDFHVAKISDGDKVTVRNGTQPDIKAVIVEEYNGKYGHLDIEPSTLIKSTAFTLENSCTLTIEGADGIVSITDPNPDRGAIQSTVVRNFGVSHYIFNNSTTVQTIGTGLPNDILSLTIDNQQGGDFNIVSLTKSDELTIDDFLYVKNGSFDAGPGSNAIKIKGNILFDNDTIRSNHRIFEFNGTGTQYITVNNPSGIVFDQLYLSKTDATYEKVEINGTASSAPISVESLLRFSDGNMAYLKGAPDHKVKLLQPTTKVERRGNDAFGHVDGILQKWILNTAGEQVLFEIGNDTNYTPVTITLADAGGTSGVVDAVNLSPVLLEPFFGNRMDPAVRVPRYWRITAPTGSSFSLGGRTFDLDFRFPKSEYQLLSPPLPPANAVIRRLSIPAETYLWTERKFDELDWTDPTVGDTAEVSLASSLPSSEMWPGLGEFYIGEKAQRIFYSRNGGGNWDDSTSWSFNPSGTPIANEFPNPDWDRPAAFRFETRDSVIIDDNDIIYLNTNPELASLEIRGDLGAGTGGTLIMPDGREVRKSSKSNSDSYFAIRENGTLEVRNLGKGIESVPANGILQFDTDKMSFDPMANYMFSGSGLQQFGDAFPDSLQNLTVNNSGGSGSDIVEMSTANHTLRIFGDIDIQQGELRPKNDLTNVYLKGGLNADGIFNGATATDDTNPFALDFTVFGDNSSSQTFSGSGSVELYSLLMNRQGAGAGILRMNISTNVIKLINFLDDPGNTEPQIISLGDNADLSIENNEITSVSNYNGTSTPAYRYIRTSPTSGSLIRGISGSGGQYVFPVGSYDSFGANPPEDHYTPATFNGDNSGGSDGTIGVRVSQGSGTGAIDKGHARLHPTLTTDYLARYWAVDNVTTTVPGKWHFGFLDGDEITDTAKINTVARWKPVKEGTPGYWAPYLAPDAAHDMAANYFGLLTSLPASEYGGDWTMANEEAFIRIFYSRQTGLWDDDQSWTFSPTHSGPIAGTGLYPSGQLDSAVVGGGNPGASIPDHIITLDLASVTIRGVAVGTSVNNSGTLLCGDNIIGGRHFTLYNSSTLGIGSADGIDLVGSGNIGNIQTTVSREYSVNGPASFIYNSTGSNQNVGDGLPVTVRDLTIDNTGASGSNSVFLDKNINVNGFLAIDNGRFDVSTYQVTGSGGNMSIADDAALAIGGANSLKDAVDGYIDYTGILEFGIVEFYGDNQHMDDLPVNLDPVALGYGTLKATGTGTKYISNVASPLFVRGHLVVTDGAVLRNEHNTNDYPVRILHGVLNDSATIDNDGVLDIGQ